jgi:hypothetical protein
MQKIEKERTECGIGEPGLFDDDGELDDLCWDMDPTSCCCAMSFSNPYIWFSKIVSDELGL